MTNLCDKNTISRSARLRKYEVAYEECIKKSVDNSKKKPIRSEPAKKSRSIRNVIDSSPKKSRVKKSPLETKKKRSLNAYQKFVKEESKKQKYKGITSSERMTAISKEWNKQKI